MTDKTTDFHEAFSAAAGMPLPPPELHEQIGSTNDRARELAEQGALSGTAVIAAMQTKGRGRLDRVFCSEKGGLYMSVIVRPSLAPHMLAHLTCFAAVAAAEAVEALCPDLTVHIKWVNDLLLDEKKVAGILTEAAWEPTLARARYVIVGIGINVINELPAHLTPIATTLAAHGAAPSLAALAGAIVGRLSAADREIGTASLLARYRSRCMLLGRTVNVHDGACVYPATVLHVTKEMALRVRCADGTEKELCAGEVSVRPSDVPFCAKELDKR